MNIQYLKIKWNEMFGNERQNAVCDRIQMEFNWEMRTIVRVERTLIQIQFAKYQLMCWASINWHWIRYNTSKNTQPEKMMKEENILIAKYSLKLYDKWRWTKDGKWRVCDENILFSGNREIQLKRERDWLSWNERNFKRVIQTKWLSWWFVLASNVFL